MRANIEIAVAKNFHPRRGARRIVGKEDATARNSRVARVAHQGSIPSGRRVIEGGNPGTATLYACSATFINNGAVTSIRTVEEIGIAATITVKPSAVVEATASGS